MATQLTEKRIQSSLWGTFSSHKYRFVNIRFFNTGEECDFISFLVSGYCQEIEIKISRSDFYADFNKPKHKLIKDKKFGNIANRFYYAVPKDMVTVDEIPSYAGLIYISENGFRVDIIRKSPLIHKVKHDYKKAFNKMYYVYEEFMRSFLRGIYMKQKTLF